MKLLLTSNGFTHEVVIAKCEELVGKSRSDINVALINEGYTVENGDHTWLFDDWHHVKENFGGSFELVNLLGLSKEKVVERLSVSDIIFVTGGHTDYLMSVFDKTGFSDSLRMLLQSKVYVGISAGSMVLGRRNSTSAYLEIYDESEDYGVSQYLNVVDVSIKPHLNSSVFPKTRRENLLKVAQDFIGTIFAIDNFSAIVVDGDPKDYYLIGNESLKIVDGIEQ